MSLEHNEQMLPVDLVAPNAFGSYMGSQHDGNGNGNSGESDTFAPLHSASSSSVNELCHSFGPNPAPVPAPTPMPMIGSGGAIPQSIDHFSSQTYTGLLPAPMMAHGATTPSTASNENLGSLFHNSSSSYQLPPLREPSFSHSHSHSAHPSTSSISSIIASPDNGMFVQDMGEEVDSFIRMSSRHPSMTSLASVYEKDYQSADTPHYSQLSNASITTDTIPRTPAKGHQHQRSLSRPTPYSYHNTPAHGHAHSHGRHSRSASISSNLSYSNNGEIGPSYWTPSSLEHGQRSMTVQERRRNRIGQSVDYGSSVARPTLTRGLRSTSMSVLRRTQSVSDFEHQIRVPSGLTYEAYAEFVHKSLKARADRLLALGPGVQQDKARNLWVRDWLRLSYTESDVKPIPRQGLHYSYSQSCKAFGLKPIISASFGKAIKATFPNVKTRRLGHRGDSKYHLHLTATVPIEFERLNYWVIKMKPEWKDSDLFGGHTSASLGTAIGHYDEPIDEEEDEDPGTDVDIDEHDQYAMQRSDSGSSIANPFAQASTAPSATVRPAMHRRHTTAGQQSINAPSSNLLSPLPIFDNGSMPMIDLSLAQAQDSTLDPDFPALIQDSGLGEHQSQLIHSMLDRRFGDVENLCRQYWHNLSPEHIEQFAQPAVSAHIKPLMATTFDRIIGGLVDQIVKGPGLDFGARADIGLLTYSLKATMNTCLMVVNPLFAGDKLEVVESFAHILHRLPELAQLSETLSATLAEEVLVEAMRSASESIQVHAFATHCWLSTGCPIASSSSLLGGLSSILEAGVTTVSILAQWLGHFVSDSQLNLPINSSQLACITSEIIRTMSLRCDKSIAQFQLLKLWMDEYVALITLRFEHTYSVPADLLLQPFDNLTVGVGSGGLYGEVDQDLPTAVPPMRATTSQQPQQSSSSTPPVDSALMSQAESDFWTSLSSDAPTGDSNPNLSQQQSQSMLNAWVMPKSEPIFDEAQ